MASSLEGKRIFVSGLILLSFLFSGCVTREASSPKPADMTTEALYTPVIESTPTPMSVATEPPAAVEPTVEDMATEPPDLTPEPTPSWLDLYEPVFENYRAVANHGMNSADYDISKDTYGILGSWDLTTWQDVTYGYSLLDIDGNGIPELIVGNMASADDNRIHALFTLVDAQPQMILYSFTRSSYYLTGTGDLYHHGSSSAMWTDSLIYSYSGTELTPLYGCFTSGGIDNGGYDYGFYKVTNGDRYTGNVKAISQEEYEESHSSVPF